VRLNAPLRANQLDRFTASRVPATNLSRTALPTQLQIKFFLVFREGPRNYQATEKNCDANGGLSFVVVAFNSSGVHFEKRELLADEIGFYNWVSFVDGTSKMAFVNL
jgi:hypothetical protein